MTASPEGKETPSGSERPGGRADGRRPLPGFPEGSGAHKSGSAWERRYDQEQERRRREQEEAERLMSTLDEEPGRSKGDEHYLVWVTPEIALCPICRQTYKRQRLPTQSGYKSSVAAAPSMNEYINSIGLFQHAAGILRKRQDEAQAKQDAKEAKKRGGKPDYRGMVR